MVIIESLSIKTNMIVNDDRTTVILLILTMSKALFNVFNHLLSFSLLLPTTDHDVVFLFLSKCNLDLRNQISREYYSFYRLVPSQTILY